MPTSVPVDDAYHDGRLARLYDAENPWGPSDEFYLDLVLAAASVLDVGCGTGTLLCRARERGHRGDLVGVDPGTGMLAIARAKRADVDWRHGAAQTLDLGRAFELVTMTGHAFQVLLDDESVLGALTAFRRHVTPGGRVAFETRNPAARPWEGWTPDRTRTTVLDPDGAAVEVWYDVVGTRPPDLVDFVGSCRFARTGEVVTSRSTLRFIEPDRLRELLTEAGLRVEGWFGDWDRSPVTPTSPEVVVVASA
jgi:SAM-dependent methyltransferase